MARLTLVTLVVAAATLATMTSAMGPNYMPDHDVEQARLAMRRSVPHAAAHGAHGHVRRSATGSRRAKRSCKAGSSSSSGGGSSTGGNSNGGSSGDGSDGGDDGSSSSATSTASASSSTSSGTVGGAGGGDGTVSSSTLQSLIKSTGIDQFINSNTGIGSWFRTNSGGDSTNGMSWCQTHYQDDWPGFAPDVTLMLSNFGGDYTKAATAYCGLEAIVTTPDGVSKTAYIVDGFDHKWVRTPGSIDITKGFFASLFGSDTDNKNDVIQGLSWKLTGNRKAEYGFRAGKD